MNNSIELKKKLKLYPLLGKTCSSKSIFMSVPKEEFSQVYSDFTQDEHLDAQSLHEETAHSMKIFLKDRILGKYDIDQQRKNYDQQILQMTLHLDEMIVK